MRLIGSVFAFAQHSPMRIVRGREKCAIAKSKQESNRGEYDYILVGIGPTSA
jgi:hypothetical protein